MSTPISSQRIALVTGARGGIGRELVARLRSGGHRVAAVGRDSEAFADVPGMTETPVTAGMLRVDAMREGAGKQYPGRPGRPAVILRP